MCPDFAGMEHLKYDLHAPPSIPSLPDSLLGSPFPKRHNEYLVAPISLQEANRRKKKT
jgi:hypothetical protein